MRGGKGGMMGRGGGDWDVSLVAPTTSPFRVNLQKPKDLAAHPTEQSSKEGAD